MKSKGGSYVLRFLLVLFTGLGIYSALFITEILGIEEPAFRLVLIIVASIFVLGTLIVAPGLNRSPHHFVLHFLVLTTVQMIALLSVAAALVYLRLDGFRTIVVHALALFLLFMVMQSVLLVKTSRD